MAIIGIKSIRAMFLAALCAAPGCNTASSGVAVRLSGEARRNWNTAARQVSTEICGRQEQIRLTGSALRAYNEGLIGEECATPDDCDNRFGNLIRPEGVVGAPSSLSNVCGPEPRTPEPVPAAEPPRVGQLPEIPEPIPATEPDAGTVRGVSHHRRSRDAGTTTTQPTITPTLPPI